MMKRLAIWALLLALTVWVGAAEGGCVGSRRVVCFGSAPAVQGCTFCLANNPSIDLNFSTGQYWSGSVIASVTSLLTDTRSSPATNLQKISTSGFGYSSFTNNVLRITPGIGLLGEYATRTNYLLNSNVPVTQTTGTLPATTYQLWVNGSGSAAMSAGTATGCGTGTASQGSSVQFVISVAGTCTVTVSGSLNFFQIENGGYPTSGIVTGGSTASRSGETIQFSGALLTLSQASQGSMFIFTSSAESIVTPVRVVGSSTGSNSPIFCNACGSPSAMGTYNGSVALTVTAGSGSILTGNMKTVVTWSASGRAIVANNGTVATDSNSIGMPAIPQLATTGAPNNSIDPVVVRFAMFPNQLSNSAAAALTQ
jgi:hypothetical protein